MGVTFPVGVFRAIPEAKPEPSIFEQLIESSSGTDTGADETPTAEAGRIRLKTRTIESKAGKSIFLFFIAAPPFSFFLYLSPSFDKLRTGFYSFLFKGKGLLRLCLAIPSGFENSLTQTLAHPP